MIDIFRALDTVSTDSLAHPLLMSGSLRNALLYPILLVLHTNQVVKIIMFTIDYFVLRTWRIHTLSA